MFLAPPCQLYFLLLSLTTGVVQKIRKPIVTCAVRMSSNLSFLAFYCSPSLLQILLPHTCRTTSSALFTNNQLCATAGKPILTSCCCCSHLASLSTAAPPLLSFPRSDGNAPRSQIWFHPFFLRSVTIRQKLPLDPFRGFLLHAGAQGQGTHGCELCF